MVFLWILLAMALAGIMISFIAKGSKARQQEEQPQVEEEEKLPKLNFDD